MVRKTREEKAITLIALIITIVVLLILAVVTINAVTGDGIIQHAVNAKTEYEKAQDEEQKMISYYESFLLGTVGKWIQEGSTITKTNADGTKTQVKIGDYVDYNEGSYTHTPDTTKGVGTSQTAGSSSDGYTLSATVIETEDLDWRVLGVNKKGELELISANPTTTKLYLANNEGYVNAVTKDGLMGTLDKFCNDLYGKGTNSVGKKVSNGARSLNADDINKLANYDPKTYTGYGEKWTFKYPTSDEVQESTIENLTQNMWYKREKADGTLLTDWSNITNSNYQTFRIPGETTAISSTNPRSIELIYSEYQYSLSSELDTEDGFTSEEVTEISNMILRGLDQSYDDQWLATLGLSCDNEPAAFSGLARWLVGSVGFLGNFSFTILFDSLSGYKCPNRQVRPVVTLSNNVSLTGSGSDIGSSVDNMWNIS